MQDISSNITIPQELSKYIHLCKDLDEENLSFSSNIEIVRDCEGKISSLRFFSPDTELIKTLCYERSKIVLVNYFRENLLYSSNRYNNELLIEKNVYHKNGSIAYTITYEYSRENRINRIYKKTLNRELLVGYRYDSFGRIIEKNISLNGKLITKQEYRYDVLDRIVEYKDANQKILVNKYSQNNELISYTLTDKIENVISVENHFADCGYMCTTLIVNGHTTTVNDASYVDNIVLKKPLATEDDLDIIISNLFTSMETATQRSALTDRVANIIDKSIENRVLPISLRKRALYNILVKGA